MRNLYCSNNMIKKFNDDDKVTYQKEKKLSSLSISNGIIHPLEKSETGKHENRQYGGVTDGKFNFIKESSLKRKNPPIYNQFPEWYIGGNPKNIKNKIKYIDEDIVFLGPFPKHYGHFILEGLSRLWYYLDNSKLNIKCAYIEEQGKCRYLEAIELFGIPLKNLIKIVEPVKFRNVIIPEQSIRLHDFYTIEYKKTIDRISIDVQPSRFKKIYFTKEGTTKVIGEDEIMKVFSKNGFKLFNPCSLSFKETISILKGCNSFAAVSGTTAHNAIFLKDNVECIYLNKSPEIHYIQTMIDRMKNINSNYIDVFMSLLPANWSIGPFWIGITEHLLSYFKDCNMKYIISKSNRIILKNTILYFQSWEKYYGSPDKRNRFIAILWNKYITSSIHCRSKRR